MELFNGMKNVIMEYKFNVMDVINVNYHNLNVKMKYVRFVIKKNVYYVKMDIIYKVIILVINVLLFVRLVKLIHIIV